MSSSNSITPNLADEIGVGVLVSNQPESSPLRSRCVCVCVCDPPPFPRGGSDPLAHNPTLACRCRFLSFQFFLSSPAALSLSLSRLSQLDICRGWGGMCVCLCFTGLIG